MGIFSLLSKLKLMKILPLIMMKFICHLKVTLFLAAFCKC